MPRSARLVCPDYPLHVMSRGNNRQPIFWNDDEKSYFRFLLYHHMNGNGISIYHYCLMNNHIHLILQVEESGNLAKFMKQVFLSYYHLFKNRHDYVGHLVQGRFKSIIVDSESYFLQCGKYIELNPVRGGLSQNPADYRFSSFNYYAQGIPDPLVTPNPLYLTMGKSGGERQSRYAEMVVDKSIVNSEILGSLLFFGSEEFVKNMELRYGLKNVRAKRGRPRNHDIEKKGDASIFL